MNNLVLHKSSINKAKRASLKQQKPCVIWLTGLSGSGKSTIANALEVELFKLNYHTYLLDGDNVRLGLNKDLDFSDKSRKENIRRIAELAKLFVDSGIIVISAFISPFRSDRRLARELVEEDEFIEVFVDTSLDECERRDPKGLYKKARSGQISNFTGISSAYEKPLNAQIHLNNESNSVQTNVAIILDFLKHKGYLK
ncbi:adenylyl-sulfate kinase [Campylobacter canadensis]|uniref:Adenylyl-sulfate kinase n=1 Tax=Campylobacter canadensis TaxID=449520 RepID=A0ABS7WUT7_9BACT|nr:adenylyl-sulfate kinase [Campylobacter canadensis]MBZ7988092.1 adenylyl-sulfate kinase [Campylobacter canadensis]MBZ7995542.1 adenylyl-sulfate kinase [Campylobacter canadensis]MBZ7997339.1 adenylyl-sulfate kinase [Campylobacter canadensis]MBZ7999067.1 adenylyl-sulfate kinase [Campylobacter canadensis]MBZ8000882.1 adenylyl-sulfate kinase [Campylobacter canadensis]